MSNLLLKTLRERGIIEGEVLPFGRANNAVDLAGRTNRTVMVLDSVNSGDYWVVSEEDAQRLEREGFVRYAAPPASPPIDGK